MPDIHYQDIIDTSGISNPTRKSQVETILSLIQQTTEGQTIFSNILQGEGSVNFTNNEGGQYTSSYDVSNNVLNLNWDQLETTQVSFGSEGYDVVSLNRVILHELYHASQVHVNSDYQTLLAYEAAGATGSISYQRLKAQIERETTDFVNPYMNKNFSEPYRVSDGLLKPNGEPLAPPKFNQPPKSLPYHDDFIPNPDYKEPGNFLDNVMDFLEGVLPSPPPLA